MADGPTFPPLLTGHAATGGAGAFDSAVGACVSGKAGAGDLFWTPDDASVDIAVVLEPEVAEAQALQMLFVTMVAFGDSFGAIAPPEIGVFYQWPNQFWISGASVGRARICVSPSNDAGVPDWMVAGIELRNRPYDGPVEPGHDLLRTSLWDEGAGDVDHVQMIESFARHFLTWAHRWSEDGFRPVHDAWMGRALGRDELCEIKWLGETNKGQFLAIDEEGRMLLKGKAATVNLPLDPVVERAGPGS